MLEEQAVVVAVEKDYAWVETMRKTACGACSVNKGCGTSVLSKVFGNKRSRIKALNSINAKNGDHVVLGLQSNALVRGSFAIYFAPLIGLFAGGALGSLLVPVWTEYTDGWSILFSLIGLFAGFVWLKRFSGRVQNDQRYQAVVLRFSAPSSVGIVQKFD